MPSSPLTPALAASYAYCRGVTRRAGSSFYYPLWLLPRAKRRAMYALYAFCRLADDIGDGPESSEVRAARLEAYREALAADAVRVSRPELPALNDALERFQVPRERLFDILDGVRMDLAPGRYSTWSELQRYCYHVAGAVGLACLAIWGGDAPAARDAAIRCGEAFQLTNILRDLREDAQLGRVYLPQEELAAAGCVEADLLTTRPERRQLQLVLGQVRRAAECFNEAAELTRYLPADSRAVFTAMWRTYRALLAGIERRGGDVFSRRVRLGRAKRLWIAATALRDAPLREPVLP